MSILKRYSHNYLVSTGAAIFCCTLITYICILYFFETEVDNLSGFDAENNYYQLIFSALLIAPIIEELFFRGYFTNNVFLKITSFIGIPIYIYLTDNNYLFILYFLALGLHFFAKTRPYYLYFLNAMIFSLVHYTFSDFGSFITIVPMFFQFSLGLILIWVVINFNIIRSILCHFAFNLLFIAIITIPLQFPDDKICKIEHLGYHFEWTKIPVINAANTLVSIPNDYSLTAENVDVAAFYKTFSTDELKIKNDYTLSRLKIKISRIDSTASKLDAKTINGLLKQADIIEGN